MQTPYQVGSGNAEEALDQAEGLMARDPGYYGSLGDVIESYATNARQTEGVTDENVGEVERGFMDVLRRHGIDFCPHGMS